MIFIKVLRTGLLKKGFLLLSLRLLLISLKLLIILGPQRLVDLTFFFSMGDSVVLIPEIVFEKNQDKHLK